MPRGSRIATALVFPVLFAFANTAHADAPSSPGSDRARAKEAYDRGTRAFDKGDFETAAREYADADAIAPAPASLEAAIVATMRIDDPARGSELVTRADSRALDANLAKTVNAARARFENRASHLVVDCKGASSCVLSVDGAARDAHETIFVKLGAHTIVLQRGDERIEQLIDARGSEIAFPSSSPPPTSSPPSSPLPPPISSDPKSSGNSRGISPIAFWVATGITAVAGGLTIASAVDTQSQRNSFLASGCQNGSGNAAFCTKAANDGNGAQVRTDVALGVTGALAIATAALGIFVVKWSPEGKVGSVKTTLTASASPCGASLGILFP